MSGALIQAHELKRSFRMGKERIDVLRGVELSVEAGTVMFLCGASGAGKTTLLYTLAGLEKPEAGRVVIDGVDLYKIGERERARVRNEKMGFVFQGYYLLPELTALENVLLPAMIRRTRAEPRAREMLKLVGLGGRMEHLPTELSGGEQQRVAIARALINDPAVIFADEPTGNLDSKTGGVILQLLLDLTGRHGKTLVVVTHDQTLARHGDRVLHMEDGVISEEQSRD